MTAPADDATSKKLPSKYQRKNPELWDSLASLIAELQIKTYRDDIDWD